MTRETPTPRTTAFPPQRAASAAIHQVLHGRRFLQRATLEGISHPDRIAVIEGAVRRVADVVRSAVHVLGRVRDGTATGRQEVAAAFSFGLVPPFRDDPNVERAIENYERAARFIASPECVLIADNALDGWAEAHPPSTVALGPTFFRGSPPAAEATAMASCPGGMGFHRALTLIHEALHLLLDHGHMLPLGLSLPTSPSLGLNPGQLQIDPSLVPGLPPEGLPDAPAGPGLTPPGLLAPPGGAGAPVRGGPAPQLNNPYSYEMFMVWIRCGSEAADVVESQRGQP